MKTLDGKFIVTADNLTIVFDGTTYTFEVPNNLGIVVRMMKENKFKKAIECINKKMLISEVSGGAVKETKDGKYKIGQRIVPENIKKLIDRVVSEKKPIDPILAMWARIQKAPDTKYGKISKESMFDYLINQCVKITESGLFIAYKKVRDNYKDCYSGKFDNTPGNIVEEDRKVCTVDRNITCAKGLHVGAWEYVHQFNGSRIVECLVNPEDVVSVPTDYNNQKMRVCRYKVIRDVTEFSHDKSLLLGTSVLYDGFDELETSVKSKPTKLKSVKSVAKKVEEKSSGKTNPIKKETSNPTQVVKLCKENTWGKNPTPSKVKISRVSEGRLPISKNLLSEVGLIPGSKIGVYFDNKTIVVAKISKLAEFELTVNKDGSLRLSKTILDRISKKDYFFIVPVKDKMGKKSLVISAK